MVSHWVKNVNIKRLLAVHTSLVEPLPHQITAVYSEMLTRQPLRFLLADDREAGKTIMTGLFIRELLIRGDLQRCLIVCLGSLAVQWQDELFHKFHLLGEIKATKGYKLGKLLSTLTRHFLLARRETRVPLAEVGSEHEGGLAKMADFHTLEHEGND